MTVKIKKNLEISERNNAMDSAAFARFCLALVFLHQFEMFVPRVKVEFYFWSQRVYPDRVKFLEGDRLLHRHQYKFDLISSM